MTISISSEQRALVFQGGGALGAYEAGFYETIYEKFIQGQNKQLFNIIIGTSIGAINGGVLVSYYKKNNT